MKQNKKIYAITGGIGSGKTVVSSIIASLGYPVFSCDKIYAGMTEGGELVKRLEEQFGGVTLPGGALDREALSGKVFGSSEALNKLNSITHPLIMSELLKRARAAESKLVFCEVPLLFEGGYSGLFDGVLVVLRPVEERINAVIKRSNLTREEVIKRIKSQFDYDCGNLEGCYLLHNDGDIKNLDKKVKKFVFSLEIDLT